MRKRTKPVAVILAVLAMYGFFPQSAYGDVVSCSNGVEIERYNVGSEVVFDFSYTNEVMTVSMAGGGNGLYDRITIDDQLVLEFWWRYNSQGEKALDYSTYSFQGWSVTRDGTQLVTHPDAAQPDGQTQEEQLHPNAAGQVELVGYALNQLHSSSFLQAVYNAEYQVGSNGGVDCFIAILLWIGSVISLASCAAVVPCVGALVFHLAASIRIGCECSFTNAC